MQLSAAPVRAATPNRPDASARPVDGEPTDTSCDADPLTPEQIREIAAGNRRGRTICHAAAMAAFNGWSTAVFAVLTIPFALFSQTALVVGLGLGVIAFVEFRGRRLLQQLDTKAPFILGFNQMAFALLIVGYCAWSMIYTNLNNPGRYAEQIAASPQLARMLGPIGDLYQFISLVIYGTVAVLSAVFQGSMATYYFTRSRHLRAYLNETPGWVLDLQRATAMG